MTKNPFYVFVGLLILSFVASLIPAGAQMGPPMGFPGMGGPGMPGPGGPGGDEGLWGPIGGDVRQLVKLCDKAEKKFPAVFGLVSEVCGIAGNIWEEIEEKRTEATSFEEGPPDTEAMADDIAQLRGAAERALSNLQGFVPAGNKKEIRAQKSLVSAFKKTLNGLLKRLAFLEKMLEEEGVDVAEREKMEEAMFTTMQATRQQGREMGKQMMEMGTQTAQKRMEEGKEQMKKQMEMMAQQGGPGGPMGGPGGFGMSGGPFGGPDWGPRGPGGPMGRPGMMGPGGPGGMGGFGRGPNNGQMPFEQYGFPGRGPEGFGMGPQGFPGMPPGMNPGMFGPVNAPPMGMDPNMQSMPASQPMGEPASAPAPAANILDAFFTLISQLIDGR